MMFRRDSLGELGRRFEQSSAGRALISVVIVLIVGIGIVYNLPESQLKREIRPSLRPIATAVGLDQTWSMYAPEPISQLESVQVRVQMADGPDRVWTWGRSGRIIGPFSWYHWQKLKERVVREPAARRGLARWAIRELTDPGDRPTHVLMLLRTEQLPAPGAGAPGRVQVKPIFDEAIGPRR
jgi:hypothetical protein